MSDYILPIGIELIEKFVEPRYDPMSSGLGVSLGIAMDKSTGKYYRDRLEAYDKHFDYVIEHLIVRPVFKAFISNGHTMPMYEIKVKKQWNAYSVQVVLNPHGDEFMYGITMQQDHLSDKSMWEYIRDEFAYRMNQRINNKISAETWGTLSQSEIDALDSVFKGRAWDDYLFGAAPRFHVLRVLRDEKQLIKDHPMGFELTGKGYELVGWAHRNKKLEY